MLYAVRCALRQRIQDCWHKPAPHFDGKEGLFRPFHVANNLNETSFGLLVFECLLFCSTLLHPNNDVIFVSNSELYVLFCVKICWNCCRLVITYCTNVQIPTLHWNKEHVLGSPERWKSSAHSIDSFKHWLYRISKSPQFHFTVVPSPLPQPPFRRLTSNNIGYPDDAPLEAVSSSGKVAPQPTRAVFVLNDENTRSEWRWLSRIRRRLDQSHLSFAWNCWRKSHTWLQ